MSQEKEIDCTARPLNRGVVPPDPRIARLTADDSIRGRFGAVPPRPRVEVRAVDRPARDAASANANRAPENTARNPAPSGNVTTTTKPDPRAT